MFSLKEMSSNRLFIYHLLRRSLRYHCPITACYEWDIQDVYDEMANHRNGDNPIGMTALTIKAMGDVLKGRAKTQCATLLFVLRPTSNRHV